MATPASLLDAQVQAALAWRAFRQRRGRAGVSGRYGMGEVEGAGQQQGGAEVQCKARAAHVFP